MENIVITLFKRFTFQHSLSRLVAAPMSVAGESKRLAADSLELGYDDLMLPALRK
jgi:hypothetical protein